MKYTVIKGLFNNNSMNVKNGYLETGDHFYLYKELNMKFSSAYTDIIHAIFAKTIAVVDGIVVENKVETGNNKVYSNGQDRIVYDGYKSYTRPYVQVYYNYQNRILPSVFVSERHFPNDKVRVKVLSNGYVKIIKNYSIEKHRQLEKQYKESMK